MCKIQLNFTPLQEFLTETVEPLELANHIDNIESRYTRFLLQEELTDISKKEAQDDLYFLHELKRCIINTRQMKIGY